MKNTNFKVNFKIFCFPLALWPLRALIAHVTADIIWTLLSFTFNLARMVHPIGLQDSAIGLFLGGFSFFVIIYFVLYCLLYLHSLMRAINTGMNIDDVLYARIAALQRTRIAVMTFLMGKFAIFTNPI